MGATHLISLTKVTERGRYKPFQTNSLLYECFFIIILSKYTKYTATVTLGKLLTSHCSYSSNSVQTAYHETGISNCSTSFTKTIYNGVYMILDLQNLRTFSQCRQGCNFTSVLGSICVRRAVLSSLANSAIILYVRFFQRLAVAGNWTHCCCQVHYHEAANPGSYLGQCICTCVHAYIHGVTI